MRRSFCAFCTFTLPSSRVSAHYLVGLDGQIAQFVDDADTARHAGKHVLGHREIYPLKTCPGNLDIDRLIGDARRRA